MNLPVDTRNGMKRETFEHISSHIHTLDLDLINGVILNRSSNFLSRGYRAVKLSGKIVKQHQVFAVKRWGENCIGMTVNHINENKLDNSWNNLELLTSAKNLSIASNRRGKPRQKVKSIHIDSGEIRFFNGISEASRQLGVYQSCISQILNGKQKRTKRYRFEKIDGGDEIATL
jgi:HNH endonuclease